MTTTSPRSDQAALIEDVEFLLSVGEGCATIARRLGYRDSRSLSRQMHRSGRPDLATAVLPKVGAV